MNDAERETFENFINFAYQVYISSSDDSLRDDLEVIMERLEHILDD